MKAVKIAVLLLGGALASAFLCLILLPSDLSLAYQPSLLFPGANVNGPMCSFVSGYIICPPATAASAAQTGAASFYKAVYLFNVQSWSSQSCADIALALACLSGLFFLAPLVAPRLRRIDRKIGVPKGVRRLALLGAAAGLTVFGALVFLDIVSTPIRTPGPLILSNVLGANVNYFGGPPPLSFLEVMGKEGFVAFAVATACVFVYRLREGVLKGIWKAFALFAAPVLIAFEIALFLFTPINMTIHVTQFLANTTLGAILTNWFVLVVSTGLLVLAMTHRRLGIWKMQPQELSLPQPPLAHIQSTGKED